MNLAERLAGLERAIIPAWAIEPSPIRVVWANAAAIELWRAKDLEELLARDFGPLPGGIRTRFYAMIEELRQGRSVAGEWTLYPKGIPIQVTMHSAPIELDDGSLGALQQAIPHKDPVDPAVVRATVALLHTSLMVALADFKGNILIKNPAAVQAFMNAGDNWTQWLSSAKEAAEMLRSAAAGEVVRKEVVARTDSGERWHLVEVRPVRDAVSGSMAALIHHTDETARRGAEEEAEHRRLLAEELDRTLSIVRSQREEILALSAPLLDVGDRTLALPLIGTFDRERSAEIGERLLRAIRERATRAVILDLTGAALLDASSADLLVRLIRAIQLLGARPMITGIRPELARTLASSSFEGAGIPILRSLAEGIRLVRH